MNRSLRVLLLAALTGCSSTETRPEPSLDEQVGVRRRRMVTVAEMAIQGLTRQAYIDVDVVHEEFQRQLDAVRTGYRLNVIDEHLEKYGLEQREAFRAQIESLEEQTVELLQGLLDSYEQKLWFVVTESGKMENANNPDYRSGHEVLDEKAEATVLQLAKHADIEGVRQSATYRAYDRSDLVREMKHDLPGVGRLMFFLSSPELGSGPGDQETSIAALVLQKEIPRNVGEVGAPVDPDSTPLSDRYRFVQAVQHRMERGGISLLRTEWKLDDSLGGAPGEVPISHEIEHPDYLVTRVFRPVINTEFDGFEAFQDYHLVAEYRSGLQDLETGEFVQIFGWQLRWLQNRRGELRLVPSYRDLVHLLPDEEVLVGLAASGEEDEPFEFFEVFSTEESSE